MRFKRQPLAEIAAQNRRRDADFKRLAEGWEPTAEDLQGTPILSHWISHKPTGSTDTFFLGHMKGHARQLDGWTSTEAVLARGENWIRLHDGFVRLGVPKAPRPEPRPYTAPTDEEVDAMLDGLPDYGLDPRKLVSNLSRRCPNA
jgi:hypothetical protein